MWTGLYTLGFDAALPTFHPKPVLRGVVLAVIVGMLGEFRRGVADVSHQVVVCPSYQISHFLDLSRQCRIIWKEE
jgi:hypothetical protein